MALMLFVKLFFDIYKEVTDVVEVRFYALAMDNKPMHGLEIAVKTPP